MFRLSLIHIYNGYRQIQALQKRFADVPIDAVYSSDLFRTMTTAPVSYTHLDVYKRQPEALAKAGKLFYTEEPSRPQGGHLGMGLYSACLLYTSPKLLLTQQRNYLIVQLWQIKTGIAFRPRSMAM